jgi:hypothetical protein
VRPAQLRFVGGLDPGDPGAVVALVALRQQGLQALLWQRAGVAQEMPEDGPLVIAPDGRVTHHHTREPRALLLEDERLVARDGRLDPHRRERIAPPLAHDLFDLLQGHLDHLAQAGQHRLLLRRIPRQVDRQDRGREEIGRAHV